jgi:fumarate hydratase subunit beta
VKARVVRLPFAPGEAARLRAGETVLLHGVVYAARDAAHARIVECLRRNRRPPFSLRGATIYYCGPSPALPGRIVGAAGPTTSSRMDRYASELYARGVAATVGKGDRGDEVCRAIVRRRACYLAATGGAGALLAECIRRLRVIAYPDLGPEAVYEMIVEGFPAIVAIDATGKNLFRR